MTPHLRIVIAEFLGQGLVVELCEGADRFQHIGGALADLMTSRGEIEFFLLSASAPGRFPVRKHSPGQGQPDGAMAAVRRLHAVGRVGLQIGNDEIEQCGVPCALNQSLKPLSEGLPASDKPVDALAGRRVPGIPPGDLDQGLARRVCVQLVQHPDHGWDRLRAKLRNVELGLETQAGAELEGRDEDEEIEHAVNLGLAQLVNPGHGGKSCGELPAGQLLMQTRPGLGVVGSNAEASQGSGDANVGIGILEAGG